MLWCTFLVVNLNQHVWKINNVEDYNSIHSYNNVALKHIGNGMCTFHTNVEEKFVIHARVNPQQVLTIEPLKFFTLKFFFSIGFSF